VPSLGFVQLIYFGGQDEIALRQTVDLVRPGRDFDSSPGKEDVWVVPLLLGKLTYAVHKLEGSAKVGKLEGLRNVVFFDDAPPIDLFLKCGETLTLERGQSSTARNARLGCKVRHGKSYSTTHARDAQSTSLSAA
jgi:hypothetical protein